MNITTQQRKLAKNTANNVNQNIYVIKLKKNACMLVVNSAVLVNNVMYRLNNARIFANLDINLMLLLELVKLYQKLVLRVLQIKNAIQL
jgi:hypothetical protein